MSDDGFCDYLDEPNMEIEIKTLMGTTFDIKVSSTETIGDIKKKIYRVEGIPVYQQNLIFQSKELKDTSRLCDAGVRNGSTLTLVSAMRGGPISTRRLSVACEHHVMLKELKELLENTRDEITPGSKVSVLVFKEGDIINLLRVIENEDGSYSPYSEKSVSPPVRSKIRKESQVGTFARLVEDTEMCTKIADLRKKMADISMKKQTKSRQSDKSNIDIEDKLFGEASSSECKSADDSVSFKFFERCASELMDNVDLTVFERTVEEGNQSESEEVALKDKHRTKQNRLPKNKSLYSETKGAYSHTKHNYARMHKKRDLKNGEGCSRDRPMDDKFGSPSLLSPLDRGSIKESNANLAQQLAVLEENDQDVFAETVPVPTRNRVHLTRLVISESAERPKSSPDSIELEENAQDLWEIHEPASERLKHSTTCKVGLLKRRQSIDFGYEGIKNTSAPTNIKPEISSSGKNSSEFGVCSSNFFMSNFGSPPSAIPPQYAPKSPGICDYYFRSNSRSPLYGRTADTTDSVPKFPDIKPDRYSFLNDCSSIQRLRNDDSVFSGGNDETVKDLYGYYNLGCSADFLEKFDEELKIGKGDVQLPPVIKKKARCNQCNKRLNITNIYNCRCGKIFCSQHRYSEVHQCNYDYKTEGRKILEQQNPLVTTEKVKRI